MKTNKKSKNKLPSKRMLIAVGDRVIVDEKMMGTVYQITTSMYQLVMDGYDYSDNEAYPYHNTKKERCRKANCN